jgi:hypothetical protein
MGTEVARRTGTVPATQRDAARGLRSARIGIGTYTRGALAAAIHAGQYLHWVWEDVGHSTRAYGAWLSENFDGGTGTAQNYRRIAEAYFADPSAFTGCEGVEDALRRVKDVDTSDLPKWIGPARQERKRKPARPTDLRYGLTLDELQRLPKFDTLQELKDYLNLQGTPTRRTPRKDTT